jgi:hypothetical protein
MAYGAETAGARALAYTIYIRPSRDLVDRSWQWPESWHRAYERAAAELALAAATCVLDDLRFTDAPIELDLDAARIAFQIECKGARIYIAVLAFTGPQDGPDAPGPNGGCPQPRSIDGLVLGLRGSGRVFHLVVFHGYMPAIPGPAQSALLWNLFGKAIETGIHSYRAIQSMYVYSNAVCLTCVYLNDLLPALADYFQARASQGAQALTPVATPMPTPWLVAGAADARDRIVPDGRRAGAGIGCPLKSSDLGVVLTQPGWTEAAPCGASTSPRTAIDARHLDEWQSSVCLMQMQTPHYTRSPGQYRH